MVSWSRRRLLGALGTGTVAGGAGCLSLGLGGGASPEEQAKEHREALSRYTDVARALEDGYVMSTPYVRTEGGGVLGLPFFKRDVEKLDPEQPTVLFYNLREDGTFELLGVEWLVPAASTDSPPSMFGKELRGPTEGETSFIPDHYGLHAWLFDDNPGGLFARYHTGATPPSYIGTLETAWDALTPYYANGVKAEDAGYTNTEKCIATPDGGYGVPFVNTDYTGTDLGEPGVLLYRLTSSWTYRAMGAEWYVPAESTDAPPSLFGKQFHERTAGHSPKSDQPAHYGLHAWLFSANPAGMFAPYNPDVRC